MYPVRDSRASGHRRTKSALALNYELHFRDEQEESNFREEYQSDKAGGMSRQSQTSVAPGLFLESLALNFSAPLRKCIFRCENAFPPRTSLLRGNQGKRMKKIGNFE